MKVFDTPGPYSESRRQIGSGAVRAATAFLIAALAAFAIAACGQKQGTGGKSTTTTATTSTTESTSAPTDETGLPKERCPGAESPPNIVDVISYGAPCSAVEDAMAQLKSVSTSFRIGDFECSRTSGSELSGTWECLGEASYFTFAFGD